MSSLSITKVSKSFAAGISVIKGIDLQIRDGEFMVFVGPSGCGKTTLLRLIAGLEDVSDGEILFGDEVVNDVPPAQRGAAMVFQSYALYPHMTVAENMSFSLKLAGKSKAEQKKAVDMAAAVLQIEPLLNRKPKALSGGQRQRVAIGRAIVRNPKVFLFDEPLSNLDANLRVQMRIELTRLHRELGTTMVYVTHDQVEAMTLGQRITVFNGGRIEQVGTPLELYNQPANLFVAEFMGSPKMNLLQGRWVVGAQGPAIAIGDAGQIPISAGHVNSVPSPTLGIRPEHLRLAPDGQGLRGMVSLIEQLGDSTLVYVTLPGGYRDIAMRLNGSFESMAPGQQVHVVCDPEHARIFDQNGLAVRATPSAVRTS